MMFFDRNLLFVEDDGRPWDGYPLQERMAMLTRGAWNPGEDSASESGEVRRIIYEARGIADPAQWRTPRSRSVIFVECGGPIPTHAQLELMLQLPAVKALCDTLVHLAHVHFSRCFIKAVRRGYWQRIADRICSARPWLLN